MLCPNDHLRLIVEVLRPHGVELARRWISALMLAPENERAGIVQAIERRMVETYGLGKGMSLPASLKELKPITTSEIRPDDSAYYNGSASDAFSSNLPRVTRIGTGVSGKPKAIRKPSA